MDDIAAAAEKGEAATTSPARAAELRRRLAELRTEFAKVEDELSALESDQLSLSQTIAARVPPVRTPAEKITLFLDLFGTRRSVYLDEDHAITIAMFRRRSAGYRELGYQIDMPMEGPVPGLFDGDTDDAVNSDPPTATDSTPNASLGRLNRDASRPGAALQPAE